MSGSTPFIASSLDDTALALLGGTRGRVVDGAAPVVAIGPDPLDPRLMAAVDGHVRAGGRALVLVDAEADAETIHAATPLTGPLRFGTERSRPAATDPLLADTEVAATTPDGRTLILDRARPVGTEPTDHVLARLGDGSAVAIERPLGAGRIVVVATTSLITLRWLTAGDNAELLSAFLTGTRSEQAGQIVAGLTGPWRGSTDPAVVTATTDWLDPNLAATTASRDLVTVAGRLGRLLPAAVHDALVDFADRSHPSGALLLRGLPIGAVPPTPATPTTPTTKDHTSELALLTVARRLGQPVGYLPEHGGMIVQNILPTAASLDRQVSTSSRVELMFHTEAAFHPHRPRFLLLLCLRGDPQARTTLASIHDLLPALPLAVRRVLFEPRYRTAADESYVGHRPTQLGAPMAVLTGDWDTPAMVFDADLMVGTDREADAALHELARVIDDHHTGVVLEAGDLLVVDNAVAVHGRSPFAARFDGTDRWLQRAFVVGDLAPSAGQRVDRLITTRFAG